jgi:hypothetical protein
LVPSSRHSATCNLGLACAGSGNYQETRVRRSLDHSLLVGVRRRDDQAPSAIVKSLYSFANLALEDASDLRTLDRDTGGREHIGDSLRGQRSAQLFEYTDHGGGDVRVGIRIAASW